MQGYNCEIVFTTKELTPVEKVAFQLSNDAVKIDDCIADATEQGLNVDIDFDYGVEMKIHNPLSENPDYVRLVLVDKNGTKYSTGSSSFIEAFHTIYDALKDTGAEYKIRALARPSKNRAGKNYLTCTVVM